MTPLNLDTKSTISNFAPVECIQNFYQNSFEKDDLIVVSISMPFQT